MTYPVIASVEPGPMAAGAADGCDNRQHLGRRPEMEEGLRSHFEGANQAAIRQSAVPTSDNEQSKKGSYLGFNTGVSRARPDSWKSLGRGVNGVRN